MSPGGLSRGGWRGTLGRVVPRAPTGPAKQGTAHLPCADGRYHDDGCARSFLLACHRDAEPVLG